MRRSLGRCRLASPTLAQATDAKRAAYRAAFGETLRQADNAEVLLRYAQAAVAAEDYEGAITACERFLVIDADQPRGGFGLGVRYYRLKSCDAARTYVDQARTSAQASREVAGRTPAHPPTTGRPQDSQAEPAPGARGRCRAGASGFERPVQGRMASPSISTLALGSIRADTCTRVIAGKWRPSVAPQAAPTAAPAALNSAMSVT